VIWFIAILSFWKQVILYIKYILCSQTEQLLARAAERLQMRPKSNWMCLTEGTGMHTISRNYGKCIQRWIFLTSFGDVHLSVHCVPIPISKFVPCLKMVKLKNEHNFFLFVDVMENLINIVRQLEICTGVCPEKYKPLWESSKRSEVDKYPYQVARYSVTLRSIQCCRLVRPPQRMCSSCDRLNNSLRMKARSGAYKSSLIPPQKHCRKVY